MARAWRLPEPLKAALRLHHEAEALTDGGIDTTVRHMIAACVVADHLVAAHDGISDEPDWQERGAASLAHLEVGEDELVHWSDALLPSLDQVR